MKRLNTIWIFLLFLISNLNAQQPKKQLDSRDVENLCKSLDTVLQKEHIPGLMLAMVNKDSIIFAGGLGYSDLSNKRKVNSQTQFHLASITKFFVAMGIQHLVSEGKLKLEDKVHDIAPEVPYTNPWESTHPLRIVHLLEHTSGFDDVHLNNMVNVSGKPSTGITAIEDIQKSLNSRWKPGEMMSYSNPGYNLAGYIMEKVSGMPWNRYIEDRIFKPLQMKGSLFDLTGMRQEEFAIGYHFNGKDYTPFPFPMPGSNGAGSALVSNATDMANFMRFLLSSDQNGIPLNSDALDEMEIIHSTLASKRGLKTGYALGNDLFPNNKKISFRGHNGKGEGFVSWIFFNREAGLAYAIAANSVVNLWPISQLVEKYLTEGISSPQLSSAPVDSMVYGPMLGYYQYMNPKNERWEFYQHIFNGIKLKSIDGHKLVVENSNGGIDSLVHVGNGIFRFKGDILPAFILARDQDGKPFFQGSGGSFYRKAAYAPILFQKMPIYFGLLACILTLVYSLVGIILFLRRRMSRKELFIPLLPSVGILCFIYGFRKMGKTDEIHKELFAAINWTSFSIFALMLLFALLVISASYLLYSCWHNIKSLWVRGLLLFNCVFLFYLVALLSLHGWIGVPIWTM